MKFKNVSVVIILVVSSFFVGKHYNNYELAENTLANIQKLSDFALDDELEISRLIKLYETSVKEPEKVPKHLMWSILVNYDAGRLCSGDYCAEMNMNYPSHKTNKLITDFLIVHSDDSCKEFSDKDLVECNLDLLP